MSLTNDLERLERAIVHAPTSLATSREPFFYLVHPPEQTAELRRLLPGWVASLRNRGRSVRQVSFADLLWEIIEGSGRWQEWIDGEATSLFDRDDMNGAVASTLGSADALIHRVRAELDAVPVNGILLLVDTDVLHPFFRVRTLEAGLHDKVTVPIVVTYPGRRSGHYGLHFLNMYDLDVNYRATLIGGDQ